MNSRAQKIINGIIATPFILLGAALVVAFVYFLFCEANKAYWDYKVMQWCERDGGVTVYEKVNLTKEEYERNDGKNGAIRVPAKISHEYEKYKFFKKSNDTEIRKYRPRVVRYEYDVYRKLDDKLLGKMVTYGRIGGDFPTGISAGSSFTCADIKSISLDIEKRIFTVEGE